MGEEAKFVERVPQMFSLVVGVCVFVAVVVWDLSRPLAIVAIAGAVASLSLRLWLPLRRRKKHGY